MKAGTVGNKWDSQNRWKLMNTIQKRCGNMGCRINTILYRFATY
jgi:hypothetical protein